MSFLVDCLLTHTLSPLMCTTCMAFRYLKGLFAEKDFHHDHRLYLLHVSFFDCLLTYTISPLSSCVLLVLYITSYGIGLCVKAALFFIALSRHPLKWVLDYLQWCMWVWKCCNWIFACSTSTTPYLFILHVYPNEQYLVLLLMRCTSSW
jgi:hypothetical protein